MGIWEEILRQEIQPRKESRNQDINIELEQIPYMKLSEFAKRNIALRIYSEFLNCEIWFCSNRKMEKQIKNDDSKATIYSVDEIKHLIKLNPNPDGLRRIHAAKEVFSNSKLIEPD